MVGRRLVAVRVAHPRTARLNASPRELEERLVGRTVLSLGRRGKFIVGGLDEGEVLVAHLGMSGRFSLTDPTAELIPHTHGVIDLDDGVQVRFVDPRTFGFLAVVDEADLGDSPLARLGPDAWDEPPSAIELMARLSGRTAAIKALLLDQGPVAGLGNIYADEVLHAARIHPLTPGGALTRPAAKRLVAAMRSVLYEAIESGGTTLDDLAYLLPDGTAGENLDRLAVYGRAGLPCPVCGTPVERIVVRQRSTHFCPKCQR
jgi:formamidopyrimidine-DNA glycosylase